MISVPGWMKPGAEVWVRRSDGITLRGRAGSVTETGIEIELDTQGSVVFVTWQHAVSVGKDPGE